MNMKNAKGDTFNPHKMVKELCHIVVISENILVTRMNSFHSYAVGGKSAEYVFSFMKLM